MDYKHNRSMVCDYNFFFREEVQNYSQDFV